MFRANSVEPQKSMRHTNEPSRRALPMLLSAMSGLWLGVMASVLGPAVVGIVRQEDFIHTDRYIHAMLILQAVAPASCATGLAIAARRGAWRRGLKVVWLISGVLLGAFVIWEVLALAVAS